MSKLLIETKKDEIIKSVKEYDTVIINASTGSGKTTQVPQYLYQEGYRVIVVEPRPIEAYSGYNRLLEEMELPEFNSVVGCKASNAYKNVKDAKILFCTGGIGTIKKIERESENLVLIVDEVHEWKLPQEILIGWVNAYRRKGGKIKLVLMSASVDIDQLKDFFIHDGSVKEIIMKEDQYPIEESVYWTGNEYSIIYNHITKNHSCLIFCSGKREIEVRRDRLETYLMEDEMLDKVQIFSLHGQIPFEDQQLIFQESGLPKIIFCTNIAQSGITPPVDVVMDNLREKTIFVKNGVELLKEVTISEADKIQRKGRAGRLGPGCYYANEEYVNDINKKYPIPEIQRISLDKTVLELMGIGLNPMELKFFHQPSREALESSVRLLEELEAVKNNQLTQIGSIMSQIPIGVRYARILYEANKRGCLTDTITAVAIMSTGSVLNNKMLKEGDIWYYNFTEWEKYNRSDILAEIDIYKKYKKHKYESEPRGTFSKKNINTIDRVRRTLTFSLKALGMNPYTHTENNLDVIKCIFKGFSDSIISSFDLVDPNGYMWEIVSHSQIEKYQGMGIVFGIRKEFTNARHGTVRLISMVSYLSFEEMDDDPIFHHDVEFYYYDITNRTIKIKHIYYYRNKTITENFQTLYPVDEEYEKIYERFKKKLLEK